MAMTTDLMGGTTIKKPLFWGPLYNESCSQTAPLVTWSVVIPALQLRFPLSGQIVADLRCSGMFSISTFSPPASRPVPSPSSS